MPLLRAAVKRLSQQMSRAGGRRAENENTLRQGSIEKKPAVVPVGGQITPGGLAS